MREQKKQVPSNNVEFLILQCSVAHEEDLKSVEPSSVAVFFEKDKEKKTNHEVQEMILPVVCDSPEVATSDQDQVYARSEYLLPWQFAQLPEIHTRFPSKIEKEESDQITAAHKTVLSVDVQSTSQNYRHVLSIDVHPKEPWILTSNHGGTVCIWNYQKQETVNSFEVSIDEPVYSAKFIERKHWLITGDRDGYIHVYDYDTMEAVKNFEAHENHVMSLAVSPTYPFVLSAFDDPLIKLWGWNKDWKCMRTFEGHYNTVTKVVFDPKNDISFASASLDRRVKIWNIFTGECNTFDEQPDGQLSLQYFENKQLRYVRKFLIVISSDGVAKVWHPETRSCVDTLQGHTDRLNALCWLPEDQVLVTGSLDGTLQIWKPTNSTHRLENTTGLNLGAVNALGYIPESRRVVVGCEQGIAVVEID